MLSQAEAADIALLEFLVNVITADIGSTLDIVGLGAGQLGSLKIGASDLATYFARGRRAGIVG